MIYIVCPKPDAPSGGVFFLHRLVQLLNQAGRPALVAQTEPFEVWYDHAPIPREMIVTVSDIRKNEAEAIVIPECLWPMQGFDGIRQICFVQNFIWLPKEFDAYAEKPETWVCSRFLANHMNRVHRITAKKVTPFVDQEFWQPTPKQANRTLVSARRNPYHAQMRELLEVDGFPVEYVTEPLTQGELFNKLADCEFMVHLTHPEGWPMQCVEAMAMGTIVCGTTGGGGVEFMFGGETAMVVADPEAARYTTKDFLDGIMDAMRQLRGDAGLRSKIWQQARSWSGRYTPEVTTKELLEALG